MNIFIAAMMIGFATLPVAPEPRNVPEANKPLSAFEQAKKYTLSGDYEKSIIMMTAVKQNRTNYNEYCFFMAANHFALNNKKEAEKWIKNLNDSFEPLLKRHAALVYGMEQQIKEWKDGDIPDIGRDMIKSADRLKNSYAGKKTQEIQDEIVKKLDKLIKNEEDKKNNSDKSAQNGGNPNDPNEQRKINPIAGSGQKQSPQNATESVIMGGKGDGKVDEKALRKVAESWGTMPPAQRAKVIQDITRDLPPKFEEMIKNYFDALNKMHNIKPNK